MQKVFNGLAVFSGLVSISIVAGLTTLYLNKDNIVEDLKSKVTIEVTNAITAALPGIVDGMMPEVPELPTATGGAIPSLPTSTGGIIP
tara:strand:+ start:98 stop:361 length:264 start_codon:yes stop_codon:yes gene_type:complete